MPFPDQEFYAVRDECERFRAENERLQGLLRAKTTPGYEMLAHQIEKKEGECERLRAALKPFADLAELIECTSDHNYGDGDEWDIKIGDLRKARAALHDQQLGSDK